MNPVAFIPIAIVAAGTLFGEPSADEIVSRSVSATEADWKDAPGYSFINREVASKRSSTTVKTYDVRMIDGSPYNQLIAVNDRPLAEGERVEEDRKLQREIYKRQHESDRERNRRLA